LSHELRTPLNPVLMVAGERAADVSLPVPVRADFDMIRTNIEHEARLIEDMLDLNLIARGKISLHEAALDLHCVLQSALDIVGSAAREKGLALTFERGSPRAAIRGDPARLKQIFLNLLNNAIKFTPAGGAVRVATRLHEKSRILTEISDSGLGMTEDEIARAFEPFSQGQHASTGSATSFGGLGLGLAIVRDLVTRHHGRVSARSPGRGRGATFSVILPLLGAETAAPATVPAAPQVSHKAVNILLAEDHAATRTALHRILSGRGHAVVSVGSKQEALQAAAEKFFDLVISDIGLPDGDGYTLFSELHAIHPGVRGIALSGFGMEADIRRSQAAGFALHLVKPVSMQKLDEAIRQLSHAPSPGQDEKSAGG
jgi:CheY-like chemotaxis protein